MHTAQAALFGGLRALPGLEEAGGVSSHPRQGPIMVLVEGDDSPAVAPGQLVLGLRQLAFPETAAGSGQLSLLPAGETAGASPQPRAGRRPRRPRKPGSHDQPSLF